MRVSQIFRACRGGYESSGLQKSEKLFTMTMARAIVIISLSFFVLGGRASAHSGSEKLLNLVAVVVECRMCVSICMPGIAMSIGAHSELQNFRQRSFWRRFPECSENSVLFCLLELHTIPSTPWPKLYLTVVEATAKPMPKSPLLQSFITINLVGNCPPSPTAVLGSLRRISV